MKNRRIEERSPEKKDERSKSSEKANKKESPVEVGGRKGPDPTRYGDWEKNGRCIDF